MDIFTSLPPEIRNMIYNLLLVQDPAIPIVSPWYWMKDETVPMPAAKNFVKLTLVNKQLHDEACTAFYTFNTFSIGNGNYGSGSETNIHSMKSFLKRIPHRYVACISHLTILMYLGNIFHAHTSYLAPSTWVTNYGKNDASDMQSISRAAVRHFKGVNSIVLRGKRGPYRMFDDEPRFCRERSIDEIARAVKLLLKHPKLKEVVVQMKDDHFCQLQEATERAVDEAKCKVSVQFVEDL